MDKLSNVLINRGLWDIPQMYTNDLWSSRECIQDVPFRASRNEEAKIGWKFTFSELLREDIKKLSPISYFATLIDAIHYDDQRPDGVDVLAGHNDKLLDLL